MGSSGLKRSIAILTGLSLATMHIVNRVQATGATAGTVIHTREDKTYDWRYGKISYKKKGYGSPLLFVHDLTIGSNKDEFSYICNELSKNHTVFIPDLIGYGDSDKPAMTYTAAVFEQMLADFIKVVIASKTDIIVTGDTAPIVLKLAHSNPDMINNIIMINPLGLYDQNLIPSNETRFMKLVMDVPIIGTFYYNLVSSKQAIQKDFNNKYLFNPDKFNSIRLDELVNTYFRAAHMCGHEAKYSYASYMSKYTTCSVLHELKEINNSILIIAGEKEPEISNNIENYMYYNNAIESEIIADTKHLPHIEKPAEVIEHIEVFLS